MVNFKKIGTVIGTFGVALGVGFVMQNGDAVASRFGAEDAPDQHAPFTKTDVETEEHIVPTQAGVTFPEAPTVPVPDIPSSNATVALPEIVNVPQPQNLPLQLATLAADITPEFETAPPLEIGAECVPVIHAIAGSAATIKLDVTAPCHASEHFTVHHQGMMFTAITDDTGFVALSVPALAETSVVIVDFDDGDGAVATVEVPDFADYDRAVLQWQGDEAVVLNAYEGRAEFGDDGHIYTENPGDMTRLEAGEGGYLVNLGNASAPDALIAEVYTFPTGKLGANFIVQLVAEAEITAENCGQELAAQSIQVFPSGETSALDLTITMPACDAVGDFLILQNMFEDLTLASK